MAASSFSRNYDDLASEVEESTRDPVPIGPYNVVLRQLYSKLELLMLDIEEAKISCLSKDVDSAFVVEMEGKLDSLKARLDLVPVKRRSHWWKWIDISFRFVGVTTGIMTVGVYGSLPIILLRVVDNCIGSNPFSQLSEKVKRGVAWIMLELSGISVEVIDGPEKSQKQRKNFSESCSLLTFSHSSNIDGFLVSATCPIRHFALAKKELFMVPFFSWISLAFGGVPVDRSNRERAVSALQRASSAARNNQICIVIAPEGMRSTSGQLQPFKKGTFHMWEQLGVPIIPLIFYGAYELYPNGSWVNNTGKVYVRYLDPINCSEVQSRDGMQRLLRRRMLEAFLEPPGAIGLELTWPKRLRSVFTTLCLLVANYFIAASAADVLFNQMGHSVLSVCLSSVCVVTAITAALYVYNVYIVNLGGGGGGSGIRSSSSSTKTHRISSEVDSPSGSKRRLLVEPQ